MTCLMDCCWGSNDRIDCSICIWEFCQTTTQELVAAGRPKLTRCLTPEEREELYLPPEPRYEADPLYCLR
jgi:hypothetical protein